VGARGWLGRWRRREPGPGSVKVAVGDPSYDDWPVVRDFAERASARTWLQHLRDAGFDTALTSDWPVDRFGRGDIALRVAPGQWSDAEAALGDLE
jgi:hypothetical protein